MTRIVFTFATGRSTTEWVLNDTRTIDKRAREIGAVKWHRQNPGDGFR